VLLALQAKWATPVETQEAKTNKVSLGGSGTIFGTDIEVINDTVFVAVSKENADGKKQTAVRSKTLDQDEFLGTSHSMEGGFPQLAVDPTDNTLKVFYKNNDFIYMSFFVCRCQILLQ
jgi:hypothetical protein